MLIIFVVILMVVGLTILGVLHSLFFPFLEQLSDIKQYNIAYYGAVSSVERGMLALRYHTPGFEGESGWDEGGDKGNTSDHSSDLKDAFLELRDGEMYRSVTSRTTQLPQTGMGTVDSALAGTGSENYMALDYDDIVVLSLDVDDSLNADDYYNQSVSTTRTLTDEINADIRLPAKLYDVYDDEDLCVSSSPGCDLDGDGVYDDAMVDRSIEGIYNNDFFRLLPTLNVDYVDGTVFANVSGAKGDSVIRESHVNDGTTIEWGNATSPVTNNDEGQTVISASASALIGMGFDDVYDNPNISLLSFMLELAQIPRVDSMIYPFLEISIDTGNQPIADTHYRLRGHGSMGEYRVVIDVDVPTSDRGQLGSFTVVF